MKGQITSAKLDKPVEIREIAFMDDPRIIIIPLYINPKDLAKNSDIEIFSAPQNLSFLRGGHYRFQRKKVWSDELYPR